MMFKKKICNLSQLEGKNYFISWVKELKDEIIVFRKNGKIHVKSSVCPHFGGHIIYDKKQECLYCYWHGLKFSTNGGKCLNDKNFKVCLNSYRHKIKDNNIYIEK